jgi:hypothetical protein
MSKTAARHGTLGSCQIAAAPNTAIVANHTHISGPNSPPTFAVPWRWIENSASRIAKVTGMT